MGDANTDVRNNKKSLRRQVHSLVLAAVASLAVAGAWAAAPKIAFNIPASEFSQAIVEFYKQAQIEILYASLGSVSEIKTRAVVGELEAPEALKKMLEGTGFTFEFENERSVLVKRVKVADGSAIADSSATAVVRASSDGVAQTPGSTNLKPEMQEVVVTGSHLRGVLDIMSPLVTLDREEIKAAPYATVQDALQSLPLNSTSSMSENFGGIDNFTRGTAPNLRGLGYGATLVLVNGRRQPAAGIASDFVDISNIPWSAVDHIDVLPDGTSALYGSDAIAGVVNIIMRDELQGAETHIRAGTAPDGAAETLVAQLFGRHWDSGKWLFAYQFSKKTSLAAADRAYAANADKRPLGGGDFRSPNGSPGNILDPNTFGFAYAIPANQNGKSLTPADLLPGVVNLENQFATYDLVPEKQLHNLYLTVSQKIGDHSELFAESRFTRRRIQYSYLPFDQLLLVPSTNAFFVDPFGGSPFLPVTVNFIDDLGPRDNAGQTQSQISTLGARSALGRDWRATLAASYGRESLRFSAYNMPDQTALELALADSDPVTAFNPFGDGSHTNPATLKAIRTSQKELATSTIAVTSLVADGPLFDLPAGALKMAVGADQRRETIDRSESLGSLHSRQRFDREINSAFVELSAPIVGTADNPKAVPRLELSLAGRYESYSDFGDTFNPKIGLRWAPLEWAKLRTSWGSSFKAPRLVDLKPMSGNSSVLVPIPDPQSPTGQSIILGLQGNNSELDQEVARSWTAGIDLASQAMPGLALSLTYFDIHYENQVIQPGAPAATEILLHEDQWTGVINRNPSASEIADVCHRADFAGSVAECLASSPAAIIDVRLRNLAGMKVRGLDLKLDHTLDTNFGRFSLDLNGSYMLSFERALTKTSPTMEILNTVNNPPAVRFRSTLEWSQHRQDQPGFGARATLNYTGSYRDTESSFRRRVAAWTPLDLQLRYQTGTSDGWYGDVEILLNAVNVFNKAPPFVNWQYGYDVNNFVPYGRVIGLNLQKNWRRR